MFTRCILYIFFIIQLRACYTSFIFHENTNIMFLHEQRGRTNDYFGYSILLDRNGLYVGAPKATNKKGEASGLVFHCSLNNLDVKQIMCQQLGSIGSESRVTLPYDLEGDVWFGASIEILSNNRLLITAPRSKVQLDSKNLLLHGVNYLLTARRCKIMNPLADGGNRRNSHQAFVIDGKRREYGKGNTHVYYYAQGQVGFSVAVTKMNTIIFGTPGLLQWTGGIIDYTFNPNDTTPYSNLQPIINPYYTLELEPDDYFGYSVESGVFDKNGSVLYVGGAPRSNMAAGKVLIFTPSRDEVKPLDVRAKLVGTQAGSYFGASLCCTDINGDGLDDLLVGAPTYVENDSALPYDQGAVFIFMTKESPSGFTLVESGYVSGSGADGARFGTAIADLGDVDGNGFTDIAIGAPWENDGIGAVYIYKGNLDGLSKESVQRIQPPNARGFGWSISRGVDVDSNNCNDLAVGAFNSANSYLYRCVPTMAAHAHIELPTAVNIPHNSTTFTATFCVLAPPTKYRSDIKLNLIGKIDVDPESNRALLIDDSVYKISVTPGSTTCDQKTIYVNSTADLMKPMLLTFELESDELMKVNSTTFLMDAARLSDSSILRSSFRVQLMRDCGDDFVCRPWLRIKLEALDNPYIPGTNNSFGIRLEIVNEEEPAYGLLVKVTLPVHPKRIPSDCSLLSLVMTCELPQPFSRNEKVALEIDLEYNLNVTEEIELKVTSEIVDRFYRNISKDIIKELLLNVRPEASFSISGKAMPNTSLTISRDYLNSRADISFKHYFEITNIGPSDWPSLTVFIRIPDKTNLSVPIEGCEDEQSALKCVWFIPAKVSFPVSITLTMNLEEQGDFLKQNLTYNATSRIHLQYKSTDNSTFFEITTTLMLEPASIIWYIIVPCIFVGLFLLAIIVRILHQRGFFQRKQHEMLQREKQNLLLQESEPIPSEAQADHEDSDNLSDVIE